MDPKLSFTLSCSFYLYYSGVKCHLCSCFGVMLPLGKRGLALIDSLLLILYNS